VGPWGKATGGSIEWHVKLPPYVNHVIIFNEYPDVACKGYFKEQDKAILATKWEDVLRLLREFHGDDAKVGVFPSAEIQYCPSA